MASDPYILDPADAARNELARGWLWLGLLALIGSGIFSVLIVLSRTPGINTLLPFADFFHVSLVVHVDLSVLVWFVSLAGLIWSLGNSGRFLTLGYAALYVCAAGTLVMTVSPFIATGAPVMANYIPVLENPVFLSGLVTFGIGTLLLVVRSLLATQRGEARMQQAAVHFGLDAAAVSVLIALAAFAASWALIPRAEMPSRTYYELLFWSGGHTLQFAWTAFLLMAWLWLASASGGRVTMSPRIAIVMLFLAVAGVAATPLAFLLYDVTTPLHRDLLTSAMQYVVALPVVPVGLAALMALFAATRPVEPSARPLRAALISSLLLFGVGGIFGFLIDGSNVKIPAHYHGSIVGVTLALMGLVYYLLPRMGYGEPSSRLGTIQAYTYGLGQLMHIAGLVWSGGYGVQRKVAGAEQVLRTKAEIAGMGFMGLGGLIAIIGGILFIIVVVQAMRASRRS